MQLSIRSLLMAVTLVAIVLSFWQAEGCGGRFQNATNIVFAPDGKSLAVCSYDWGNANVSLKSYIADCDRFISIYRIHGGLQEVVHHDFRSGVLGPGRSHYCYAPLQFSSDGQSLYFPSWDANDLLEWKAETRQVVSVAKGDREFQSFIWTDDHRRLFTAHGEHLIILGQPTNGGTVISLMHPISPFEHSPMAISPDGRWLAIGSECVEVWDLQSGPKPVHSSVGKSQLFRTHGISFSSDSSRLAISGEDGLTILNLHDGKKTLLANGMELNQVALVPNSEIAIATSKLVGCINMRTQQIKSLNIEPRWPGAMALSPDGTQLAVCTARGIELWDWEKNIRTGILPLPRSNIVRWYMPWIALGAWFLVARRMWQKRNLHRTDLAKIKTH